MHLISKLVEVMSNISCRSCWGPYHHCNTNINCGFNWFLGTSCEISPTIYIYIYQYLVYYFVPLLMLFCWDLILPTTYSIGIMIILGKTYQPGIRADKGLFKDSRWWIHSSYPLVMCYRASHETDIDVLMWYNALLYRKTNKPVTLKMALS